MERSYEIGPVTCSESGNAERVRECGYAFIHNLRAKFCRIPKGIRFDIKPVIIGRYFEPVVYYDPDDAAAAAFIEDLEDYFHEVGQHQESLSPC